MTVGQKVAIKPGDGVGKIDEITINDEPVGAAKVGENVKIKVKGMNEDQVAKGYVLTAAEEPCTTTKVFEAQLVLLELLEHRPILTAGYNCVLHLHTAIEECSIKELTGEWNKKTSKKKKRKPMFVKSGAVISARIEVMRSVACEPFAQVKATGRFTLRDEGKTIAIGKVLKCE